MALEALKLKLRNAGITLTKDECTLLADDLPVSCSIKRDRSTAVVPNVLRSLLTVDFIEDQARLKWNELNDSNFSLFSDKECKNRINDNYLQVCAFPLVVFVKTTQKGFAEFSDVEALRYAGVKEIITVEENDRVSFPPPVDIKDSDKLFKHAIEDLNVRHKLYDPLEEGCEYTRREFISPILVLAASISGVKLACEEQLEGSVGKGPVDWVGHYQNHRIYIAEGKKDNITQGLYQNLAQLAAAGEGRGEKRVFSVDLPIYGIATTYTEWIFVRLDPLSEGTTRHAVRLPTMQISRNKQTIFKETVKDVASQLAGILLSQKNTVARNTGEAAKRAKP